MRQRPGYRPPISKFLQQFSIGQKVAVDIEVSSHKGVPHPRYQGRVGTVVEKRGRSYVVEIRNGGKMKKIIARPEHLKVI